MGLGALSQTAPLRLAPSLSSAPAGSTDPVAPRHVGPPSLLGLLPTCPSRIWPRTWGTHAGTSGLLWPLGVQALCEQAPAAQQCGPDCAWAVRAGGQGGTWARSCGGRCGDRTVGKGVQRAVWGCCVCGCGLEPSSVSSSTWVFFIALWSSCTSSARVCDLSRVYPHTNWNLR